MTRTKRTNTKGRETVAKMRERGVTTNYQMRRIIGGILGEEGKDRMYEERGAGRRKKGPAGQDETKAEDKPAGLDGDETKDKPAEMSKDENKVKKEEQGYKRPVITQKKENPNETKDKYQAKTGIKNNEGGTRSDTEDQRAGTDGSHNYLLVDPRPGEAPEDDNSTIVQSTGTGRSPINTLDVMDNALQSQHLKDEDAGRGGNMYKIRGAGPGGTVLGMTAGGAARSITEDQGAGLSGNVLGRTAGGATKSNTEDRGAGPGGKVLGRTAEGATRSNTDKVVKSIRGGGRRITRWERANQGGEETELHEDTQSNNNNILTEVHPAKEDAKTHTGVHKTRSGTRDSPKALTGALKTITGMLKTLTRTRDSSKALTKVRKTITRMLGARDQEEGDDSTKTPTRVLKTPTGTHHGMEDSGTGTPNKTHKNPTGGHKTRTGTPHGEKDSSTKTHTRVHARDHGEGHRAKKDLTGMLHGEHQTDDKTPTGKNVMTLSKRNPAKKTRWKGVARRDGEVEVWSFKTNADRHLSAKNSNAESKGVELKMKGDYYRHPAEGDHRPLRPLYDDMTKTAPGRVTRHRNTAQDLRYTDRHQEGRAMPGNQATRHAAPNEGLNEEEQEKPKDNIGEDIQAQPRTRKRVFFGPTNSPSIFHHKVTKVFTGLKGCITIHDNRLVYQREGAQQEHGGHAGEGEDQGRHPKAIKVHNMQAGGEEVRQGHRGGGGISGPGQDPAHRPSGQARDEQERPLPAAGGGLQRQVQLRP